MAGKLRHANRRVILRSSLVAAVGVLAGLVVGAMPAPGRTADQVTVLATANAPSGAQCVRGILTSGAATPTSATKTVKALGKAVAVLAGSTVTCQVQVGARYTVPGGGPNPVPLRIVMNGISWEGVLDTPSLGGSAHAKAELIVRSSPTIDGPVLREINAFDVTRGSGVTGLHPNDRNQSLTVNLSANVGEELYVYLYLLVQANAGRVGVADVDFSTGARGVTYNDIVVVATGVTGPTGPTGTTGTNPPPPITLTQANIPANTGCTAQSQLQSGNAAASLPAREVRVYTHALPLGHITCRADVGASFVVPGAVGSGSHRTRITMTADWSGKVEGVSGIVRVKLYAKRPTGSVLGSTQYIGVGVTRTAQGPVVSTQQGVNRTLTLTLAAGTTVNVTLYLESIISSSYYPGHLPGTTLDFLSAGYGAHWNRILVEFLT